MLGYEIQADLCQNGPEATQPKIYWKIYIHKYTEMFTFLRYIGNLKSKNILEVLHSQDMYIEKFISKNILEAFECNTSLDMLEICTN